MYYYINMTQQTHDTQEALATQATALQTIKQDIINSYIASLDVTAQTKDTYRKALKQFQVFIQGKDLNKLSRADILAYKASLQDKYKVSTVSAYISAVKGLYIYLEAEKIYPNIANGIKGGKHQQGFKKDALTIDQVKRMLGTKNKTKKTLEEKRNFSLINLLIRTGLRTIEIERANIEDIRQEGGEALLYIQGKGRESKDNFVLLTEDTLQPIREYLKARGKATPESPLFTSNSDRNTGGRLTTRSIRRIAKEALKLAGMDSDRITTHSLRHTAVTLSLLGGATIQEAQTMARHKNINTTLIYAHNINRIKQAPERKIDILLSMN
jgi:integrase/recombinase XerD